MSKDVTGERGVELVAMALPRMVDIAQIVLSASSDDAGIAGISDLLGISREEAVFVSEIQLRRGLPTWRARIAEEVAQA